MKKILFLTTFVLGVSYSAWAGSCTTEALSNYEASGFSCNIGDLTFSGFSFSSDIVDTSNNVDVTTGPEAGLDFPVDLTQLGPSNETASIGYTVTCAACTLDDWALQTGGATSTGTGAATVFEFSTPGVLFQTTQFGATTGIGSGTFSPADTLLPVSNSITLGGGSSTTVTSLGSVTNLFSQTSTSTVPEPSMLILCAGLLGLLPFARRKFSR
jgi:hypothetical protein